MPLALKLPKSGGHTPKDTDSHTKENGLIPGAISLDFTVTFNVNELPTRGFSVNPPGLFNLLNSLKVLKSLNPNFHTFSDFV